MTTPEPQAITMRIAGQTSSQRSYQPASLDGATFVPVTIWHNEYSDRDGDGFTHWAGFDPARNRMTPVFTFAYPCEDTGNDRFVHHLFETIWVMLDADVEMIAWEFDRAIATQYRYANRLRSVSGGDVIQIGPRYFACQMPGGHREVQAADLTVAPWPWLPEWLAREADHERTWNKRVARHRDLHGDVPIKTCGDERCQQAIREYAGATWRLSRPGRLLGWLPQELADGGPLPVVIEAEKRRQRPRVGPARRDDRYEVDEYMGSARPGRGLTFQIRDGITGNVYVITIKRDP
jgi:hypothetical protein